MESLASRYLATLSVDNNPPAKPSPNDDIRTIEEEHKDEVIKLLGTLLHHYHRIVGGYLIIRQSSTTDAQKAKAFSDLQDYHNTASGFDIIHDLRRVPNELPTETPFKGNRFDLLEL